MVPVSIGLHALLVVAAVVYNAILPPVKLAPPVYEVALMAPIKKGRPGGGAARNVAPAPVKETPKVPEAPKEPPPTAPGTPPKPDELVVPTENADPKAAAKAREEALARLKREAALRRIAEKAKETRVASAQPGTAANASAGGTPDTTPGGSGEGDGDGGVEYGTLDGVPGYATYEQQLQAIVTENWLPPTWIDAKDPKQCIIRVLIGFDGKITAMEYEQRSGDSAFDASAMAALRKSDPLPPPPLDTKQYLSKRGLPLRFDSRMKLAASGGGP